MAKLNTAAPKIYTHGGGVATHITPVQALRRSVMSCFLWEDEFYESGQHISIRIAELVAKVPPDEVASIAIEARHEMHLRHVPLLLLAHLSKRGRLKAEWVAKCVSRADELAELVAVACKVNGVGPDKAKRVLSRQLKTGLAAAFHRFDEYHLAKYNRDGQIKLRDVLRLVHPKPRDAQQSDLWKRLSEDKLVTPDTWEVALSTGENKKEAFERLLRENKLGYMALLRNLRNMCNAGVDEDLIKQKILARKGAEKVLPFRFIAAARHAPHLEPWLDRAMLDGLESMPRLEGRTVVLVDVSGSMDYPLSAKSDLKRIDAAAALAAIVPAENLEVFSFSSRLVQVPPRKGMAGVDAIIRSQPHGGTDLTDALEVLNKRPMHRLIVITDEQVQWGIPAPAAQMAYMINVASYRNGVGYGNGWTHIDGFSENVLRYIAEHEKLQAR